MLACALCVHDARGGKLISVKQVQKGVRLFEPLALLCDVPSVVFLYCYPNG